VCMRRTGSGSSTVLLEESKPREPWRAPSVRAKQNKTVFSDAARRGRGRRLGEADRRGPMTYEEEEERKTARCSLISLTCATVLSVWGAHLLFGSHYNQAKAAGVREYDAVVDAWSDQYREPFEQTTWALRVGEAVIPLDAAFQRDPLDRQTEDHAHIYDPLQFSALNLLEHVWGPAPEGAPGNKPVTDAMMEPYTFTLLATRPGQSAPDEMPLGQHPLLEKNEKRAGGWKVCKYQQAGYYNMGVCTTFSVFDSICVKATQPEVGGPWELDKSYGGPGCRPGPGKLWSAVSRRHTRAPAAGTNPPVSSLYDTGSWASMVRSASDPYVWAMHATHGTMYIAQPQAEEKAGGIVMLMLGAALYIPGCILGVPHALLVLKRRREAAKLRKYSAVREDGLLP